MKTKRWLSLLLATIMLLGVLPVAIGEEPAVDEVPVFDEEPVIVAEEEPAEDDADGVMIEAVTEPEIAEEEEIILGEEEPEDGEAEAPQYADFLMEGEEDDGGEYAVLAAPAGNIAIDATNFPDAAFRAYIKESVDSNEDGYLSVEEREECYSLNVYSEGISSLKGIELFPNLEYLDCSYNKLTALDISKNTQLTDLDCDENSITTLDISKNDKLESLSCSGNKLTNLDISKNTKLEYLYCTNNKLSSLNVSNNPCLQKLNCWGNKLTGLDISKNTMLESLDCDSNSIKELDLSKNTRLEVLDCSGNKLTKLDISKNTMLEILYCNDNSIATLDISKNVCLEELVCNDNNLTKLDVSKNTQMKELYCNENNITSLDVSKCEQLKYLWCTGNYMTTLVLGKNTQLESIWCYDNKITKLNLSNCSHLVELGCLVNQIKTLDVSGNPYLTDLYCRDNQLTTLDISKNTQLRALSCRNNNISSLDISKCPMLKKLVKQTKAEIVDNNVSFEIENDDYNYFLYFDTSTKLTADGSILYNQLPSSISFSQKTMTLGAGEKIVLQPVILPEGAASKLSYKTTKSKVATVAADGTITAKKKGTTYVTVTTANGKKATIKVVVKKAPSKVTISPKKLILNEGLTGQLKATLPKKTAGKVTFTSNNTKVATVDASTGKVTAVAAGTATITAKTYNGKTSACTVTVITGKAPTKLTLNMTSVKLGKGQKEKIVPTLNSGENTVYTYSSSRKKVATVAADGTITGKKKGKAVITVKTHNGLAAKVTVTVSNAPKKVTLSAKTLILNEGVSGKLTAKLPKGTYSPITLTSSSTGIATVDASGNVKAVKAGKATITAKTFNNKSANCVVTVLTGTAPTSVSVPEATITLAKGSTYKIVPKLNSGANTIFTYTAKNKTKNKKKIATVSADGTITAKVKGTAIITVKTHNGKTATVTVTVK